MGDGATYRGLQELSEEPRCGGNGLVLRGRDDSPGLKRELRCLARPAARLMLVGLLVSVSANVILVGLLVGGARRDASCESCSGTGWLLLDDQCYYFSSDKMDWLRSRASCEEMGGHLTILHSMEQHDAVERESKRIGGFDFHFWIGLSDREQEGDWRWVDNTTLQHKYWDQHSSEPDNHQSGGEHGEDCATLNSHSKTWFDVPCDNIHKRICQTAAVPRC